MDPDPGFSGPTAAKPIVCLPMKIFFASLFTVLALATAPAFAQEPASAPATKVSPATEAAVRELLNSLKYREMMAASMKSMQKQIPVMVLQTVTNQINANKNLSDAEKKEQLDKAAQDIPAAVEGISNLLADPKLIDDMLAEIIPLYARHFTVKEIKELAAIYKTPLGVKMLATMPALMSESMEIGNRVMAPRLAKYFEKIEAGKKQGTP
jgi:hypothetical protein